MTAKTSKPDPYAHLLTDVGLCNCATCREVLDEALRDFQRKIEEPDKCPGWFLASALATSVVAMMLVQQAAERGQTSYAFAASEGAEIFSRADVLDYISEQILAVLDKPKVLS